MRACLLQRDVGRLRADLLPAVRAHALVALLAQPAQARGAEGVAAREEQRWLPLLAAHQLEADAAPARSGVRHGRASGQQASRRGPEAALQGPRGHSSALEREGTSL